MEDGDMTLEGGVNKCKKVLADYFHPNNTDLEKRFKFIYKLFGLTDDGIARVVGIDRTTMNRYRRGIFWPSSEMKLLIAKAISKLAEYPVDSSIIWGSDLFFDEWKREQQNGE